MLERAAGGVATAMAKLGAGELIAACPHCQHALQDLLPDLKSVPYMKSWRKSGCRRRPREVRSRKSSTSTTPAAPARPPVRQPTRHLLKALGHDFVEMAHCRERSICCGSGGMAPTVAPALAQRMTEFRLSKAQYDLVTYCAACRAHFAHGRPAGPAPAGDDLQPRLAPGQDQPASRLPAPLAAALAAEAAF